MDRFRPQAVQQYLAPENQGRVLSGRYPSEGLVGAGVALGFALLLALGVGTDVPARISAHGVVEREEQGRVFVLLSLRARDDLRLVAGQEVPLSIAGAAAKARIHAIEPSAVRASFPANGRALGSRFEATFISGRVSLLRSVLASW